MVYPVRNFVSGNGRKQDISNGVYLFIGEDELSKKVKLQAIKKENISLDFDNFNSQIFFAKDLKLLELQETLLKYPLIDKKTIVIIKEIENLSQDVKDFILDYLKKPASQVVLILDTFNFEVKDTFINKLTNDSQIKVLTFKRSFYPNVFNLERLINQKKTQDALILLNELLLQKTRPEKILGGLRYQWEKGTLSQEERIFRFESLLEADKCIKTGILAPEISLERLIVKLCSL